MYYFSAAVCIYLVQGEPTPGGTMEMAPQRPTAPSHHYFSSSLGTGIEEDVYLQNGTFGIDI